MASIDLRTQLIDVPPLTQTMVERAVQAIEQHARSEDELEEFLAMVRPDLWLCGYCGKFYPVPSLARSCEARHEENNDG